MKKSRIRLLLMMGVLMLSLTMVAACSDDDDDSPTAPQTSNPPVFPLTAANQMQLPDGVATSGDAQAATLLGYTALANSFSGYLSFFAWPASKAATDGPPWVTTWSIVNAPYVDLAITFTVDENQDAYTWEYKVDGHDEDGTYDNAVFYEAHAAKDGSWGDMRAYDIDYSSSTPVLYWEWAESALGAFSMEFISYDESDPLRAVFGVDPDGSGDMNLYEYFEGNWRILEYYEWTALGGGSYILYDYDGGEDVVGSWTPGSPM